MNLQKARQELLSRPTRAQRLLRWHLEHLGYVFEQEAIIGKCIVDFFLPNHKLVIEVDGWYHRHFADKDQGRDKFFDTMGLKIVRVKNKDVFYSNAKTAIMLIQKAIADSKWNAQKYRYNSLTYKGENLWKR